MAVKKNKKTPRSDRLPIYKPDFSIIKCTKLNLYRFIYLSLKKVPLSGGAPTYRPLQEKADIFEVNISAKKISLLQGQTTATLKKNTFSV